MLKHLNDIKNYNKTIIHYNNRNDSIRRKYEVSKHFAYNHDVNKDFKVCVFRNNIKILEDRLNIENDLIHLFLNMQCVILNEYVPYYNKIKVLCYNN